jgi:hypothetical protein
MNLMLIRSEQRDKNSLLMQKAFTDFGCFIKLRLGLHDTDDTNACSNEGVIILQLQGEEPEQKELEKALNDIDGVRAKLIEF